MKKRMLAVLCLLVLVVIFAGCTIVLEERRAFLETENVLPQQELVIRTENGYVNIEPATGSDIVIDGEKVVRGDNPLVLEAYLSELGIAITEEAGKVEIAIKRNPYPVGVASVSVNLTVQVPIDIVNNVNIITTNGQVTVEGVNGVLKAQTSNGEIEVNNVTGYMDLYTSNGKITGNGIAGQITADSTNGTIDINTDRELDDATLSTTSAAIYYYADIQDFGSYDFYTSSGSIELYLQSEPRFSLTASAANGQIMCDYPVDPVPAEQYPDEIEGEINGGGAIVELHTSNNNIIISERW